MSLYRLSISDLRNLQRVELEPGPGVNVIWGPNASGKTSLLEGVYLLGRGRSFRTRDWRQMERWGGGPLRVVGRLADGRVVGAGLGVQGAELRLGGAAASQADLARALPLVLLGPESHTLVTGGPAERRRLLDWGVFHVEPAFFGAWRRYRRALEQRNRALREGLPDRAVRAWDPELETAGHEVHAHRAAYVAELEPVAARMATRLLGLDGLELGYRRGWQEGKALGESLGEGLGLDRERGHTGRGPHRAELALGLGGRAARTTLSRGQQKLLVCALCLAQAELLRRRSGRVIFLVDDLAAELDGERRGLLLGLLNSLGQQAFVTGTDRGSLMEAADEGWKAFHVEQGAVRQEG